MSKDFKDTTTTMQVPHIPSHQYASFLKWGSSQKKYSNPDSLPKNQKEDLWQLATAPGKLLDASQATDPLPLKLTDAGTILPPPDLSISSDQAIRLKKVWAKSKVLAVIIDAFQSLNVAFSFYYSGFKYLTRFS